MALDTRGLASGFAQGFGLIDNYYNRQAQNERADKRLGMQEETFEMQKQQFEGQQEKEKATFIMGKIAQNMMPSDEELQWLKDRPNYLTALNPETDKATFIMGKIAQNMMPSDEELQWLKDRPNYLTALNPETDKALEIAQRVIDPQDDLDLNSDEGLYALNTMFEPMINRGKGGRKRIAAGLPGRTRGTMAFELDVEGEDGTKSRRPMTQNRGIEGEDDIIKEVPVENLVNATQGVRMLRNVINTNGASENAAKLYAMLTGKTPERTKGEEINGRLVNPYTGEEMGDFRTPEQRGERGSGKAPADVQTAEWMVANNMAPNLDVAFNRVNESRTDPARFVNDFVTQEMKFQEASGIYPDSENFRTPKQLREQAVETLQMIRSRTRGNGSQPGGQSQPRGLEMTGSEAEVLPQDGSAVPQPDGSYSGRVNRNPEPAATTPANPAPAAAVEHLRQNPQLADQFQKKYGYLPEGF